MTDDTDDGEITPDDLAAAAARWADPKHRPAAPELFARPVVGDGFRGDVTVGDALAGMVGRVCTAKRLDWDLDLDAEENIDRDEMDHESDDIEGVLAIHTGGGLKVYLVGGQEADPATIRPAAG